MSRKATKTQIESAVEKVQASVEQQQIECWTYIQNGDNQLLEVRVNPEGGHTLTPCDLSGNPIEE